MRRVTDDVNSPELPGSESEKKGGGEDGDASDGSTRDAEETPSKSKDGDSAGSKETGPNADDASKGSGTEEGDADAAKKARCLWQISWIDSFSLICDQAFFCETHRQKTHI